MYCPNCGAEIPFGYFCKQVAKRKYDRKLLLKIITSLKRTTTGEVAKKYQQTMGTPVSLRQLNNMLHDLESMGQIILVRRSLGRYGRTTEITLKP